MLTFSSTTFMKLGLSSIAIDVTERTTRTMNRIAVILWNSLSSIGILSDVSEEKCSRKPFEHKPRVSLLVLKIPSPSEGSAHAHRRREKRLRSWSYHEPRLTPEVPMMVK